MLRNCDISLVSSLIVLCVQCSEKSFILEFIYPINETQDGMMQ